MSSIYLYSVLGIGYGFVHFETHEMAQNAVKWMDGATIQGQIIKCQLRNGKESEPKPSKFIF